MHKSFTAFSSNTDMESAFADILTQLNNSDTNPQIIFFTTSNIFFPFVSEKLSQHFPRAIVIGSTSCYQFNSAGNGKSGISVMTIEGGIQVASGVLFDVARNPLKHIDEISKCLSNFKSFETMCCIEFTTAHSNGEELVLDTFGKLLHDKGITVFGGTSGSMSDDKTTVSMVSLNGKIYYDSCVFVLIKNLDGSIFTYNENIYIPTKNVFTATDVDCDSRTVYEYNEEPAALAIAKILETDVSNLSIMLEGKPMGRCVNDDVYITEACKVNPDYSITYYSRIYNYTKIALMRTENIPEVFAKTKRKVKNSLNSSFMIAANCASRQSLFEKEGLTGIFMDTLKDIAPAFFGISGFGEQINNIHLNQTMVLIAFE